MRNERLDLAMEIVGNKGKALLLLKLIDMTVNKGGKFPDLKMVLPEESEPTCRWNENGNCYICMPDSLLKCKGKCGDYWEIDKESDVYIDKGDVFDDYFGD